MIGTLPLATPRSAEGLEIVASTTLPTHHGEFRFLVFRHHDDPSKEHVALVRGDVTGHDVLVRVHSECLTSEVFGSLKCDCASQLDLALIRVACEGRGAVVYLRQDGRGIGLTDEIRAYEREARGLDTIDANRALLLPVDARRYGAAAALLRELGVASVRLMTNSPAKVAALQELGTVVRARVPHLAPTPAESLKRSSAPHAAPIRR